MQEIINLKQAKEEDLPHIGVKAAYLGSLSHGFNVAPGFVLTKDFFNRLMDDNDLRNRIKILLVGARENEDQVEQNSNEIQKLILGMRINEQLTDNLQELYYGIGLSENEALQDMVDSPEEPIVVIRTSPVRDCRNVLSLLHVQGVSKLNKGILACFASIYNPEYIVREDLDMGVMIQKMIIPNISGYIEIDNEEIIVNACYGLSDKDSEYDNYIVNENLEIKTVVVERQETAYMLDSGKLSKLDLPEMKATSQKLNEKQIAVLARLFKKTPYTDKRIEFMIDRENYYFTQIIEPEEGKMEEKKKENTMFSIFNANKGDEAPDIPMEPTKEEDKPVEEQKTEKAADTVSTVEQPVEQPTTVQPTPEPASQEEQKTPVTTVIDSEEESRVQVVSTPEPIKTVQPEVTESEVPKEEEKIEQMVEEDIETEEKMLADVSPPESVDRGLRPLNATEWLDTLKLEHTKLLLSYDLVILNALKNRYKEHFSKEPGDFEEMLEELKTKVAIPGEQNIKNIRAMRNKFLYQHKTIEIQELKDAYIATEQFLKNF